MSPDFTLRLSDVTLNFHRLVRLTHVDGTCTKGNTEYPKVHFSDYDRILGQECMGVSLVVQNGNEVLFCTEHSNPNMRVAKKWLYARWGYLYWKEYKAAEAFSMLDSNDRIEIYFSTRGDASQIISEKRPAWNQA